MSAHERPYASVPSPQRPLDNLDDDDAYSPSSARRRTVLTALSPLTRFTTTSLGLKPTLHDKSLTREQARARRDIPSPPSTTYSASAGSRDRPPSVQIAEESGHQRTRVRTSPRRSPTTYHRSPSLDASEVSPSGERSSTFIDVDGSMSRRGSHHEAGDKGNGARGSRVKLRTEQRERNQRVIDSINATIVGTPSSGSMKRGSSSSSTLSPGPSRDRSINSGPLHGSGRSISPEETRWRGVIETDSEAFADAKRNSVVSLSSAPVDEAAGTASSPSLDTSRRDEIQAALDDQADHDLLFNGRNDHEREDHWHDLNIQTRRLSETAARAQTVTGYSSADYSSPRHRRTSDPYEAIQAADAATFGTLRTATIGRRTRPSLPREFLDAGPRSPAQARLQRSRTPSLSSASEYNAHRRRRDRYDSQGSQSSDPHRNTNGYSGIAANDRLNDDSPSSQGSMGSRARPSQAPGTNRNGSHRSHTPRSQRRASLTSANASTVAAPEVGSDSWWAEVDELRQRPMSRASTVFDPPAAGQRVRRAEVLRSVRSSLGMHDESASEQSISIRRSRTSLGQTPMPRDSPSRPRPGTRVLRADEGRRRSSHHTLLDQALERCTSFLGGENDAEDLLKQVASMTSTTTKLRDALHDLEVDISSMQVELVVEGGDNYSRGRSRGNGSTRLTAQLLRLSDEQIRSLTELLLAMIRRERGREGGAAGRALGGPSVSRLDSPRLAALLAGRSPRDERGSPSAAPRPSTSSGYEGRERSPLHSRSLVAERVNPAIRMSLPFASAAMDALPSAGPHRPIAKSSTASDATVRRSSTTASSVQAGRSPGARLTGRPSAATATVDNAEAFAFQDASPSRRSRAEGEGLGLGLLASSGDEGSYGRDQGVPSRRFSGAGETAASALRSLGPSAPIAVQESLRRARSVR